jgi:hypothetical protein
MEGCFRRKRGQELWEVVVSWYALQDSNLQPS